MLLEKLRFNFPPPPTGVAIILLAITQLPFAVNETVKLACFATTWADYAVFWNWKDIPIDSRVRYCQGGSVSPRIIQDNKPKIKVSKSALN